MHETSSFSSPSTASARRFWTRLALFATPFIVGFSMLTGALAWVGESAPLAWVAQAQDGAPVLFRVRYGNRDQTYKALMMARRQPDVLVVGSSRVLQFRAGLLDRNPAAFYNAGAPAWRLEQVDALLRELDDLPAIVLFGLDPPWFNTAYAGDVFPPPISDFHNLFLVNRSFIQDVLRGERFDPGFYLSRVEPGRGSGLALGMRAIRDGHGFRSDGSEQYGDFLVAKYLWQPHRREDHLEMMRAGEDIYPYGDSLSAEALARLDALLDYLQARDVLVVGFLPSYMPSLWAEMNAMPEHAYVRLATETLRQRFETRAMPFLDFSDGAWIGATDEDFFDGWHASERANLQLYLRLLDAVPQLAAYSDAGNLNRILATATDTWAVFE